MTYITGMLNRINYNVLLHAHDHEHAHSHEGFSFECFFDEVVLHALEESFRLLPFLFLTYLAMEFLEHKTSTKTKGLVRKSGKAGPLVGAVLGAFPQCGFSTVASNLYAGRVITLGTLFAIFLSTSDEMLPVLLSENIPVTTVFTLVGIKVVIGMIAGFAIDFIFRNSRRNFSMIQKIGGICSSDRCSCDKGVFGSAVWHTGTTFLFIVLMTFGLNTLIYFVGEEALANIILNKPVIGPMISTLVGIIPNCAASVVLTQLYVGGVMSIGSLMAGLLAGAGVGILVLFRENRNLKENLCILGGLYAIGVCSGIVIDLIMAFV